jgi:hypothetical protein
MFESCLRKGLSKEVCLVVLTGDSNREEFFVVYHFSEKVVLDVDVFGALVVL